MVRGLALLLLALLGLSSSVSSEVRARQLTQYTPDQADWSSLNSEPIAVGNTAHDPDGVFWISQQQWADAEWDGTTIYNPSKMPHSAFRDAICPSADRIRGLRELFYAQQPPVFADNLNPTKAEVDNWHRIVINHIRALVGYTAPERQVHPDICMHARALWGDQRMHTTQWDAAYPANGQAVYGPCQGSSNAHCGATFVPSAEDQAPFLPPGHPMCTAGGGAEGIYPGPKTDIPWSIKISRAFCNTLMAEGFWGGHVGPWYRREKFGLSFWHSGVHAPVRGKWTGRLMPYLHCNPADPTCDPDNTGPTQTTGTTASSSTTSTSSSAAGSTTTSTTTTTTTGTTGTTGCVAATCANYAGQCGQFPDNCGGITATCMCTGSDTCNSSSLCQACQPDTCLSLGATCGVHADRCGGTVSCGSCAGGEFCFNARTCQAAGCTPSQTCQPNSCGTLTAVPCVENATAMTSVSCGSCSGAGETCSVANLATQAGTCGCTPLTCPAGQTCGSINDGCGNIVSCGTCSVNSPCQSSSLTCQSISCAGANQVLQAGACVCASGFVEDTKTFECVTPSAASAVSAAVLSISFDLGLSCLSAILAFLM